ncbi:MAG: DUF5680 domain-containing protein [Betaproteobacteria bacterium]
MDIGVLAKFLVEANRATYAGDGPRVTPLLPGSRQLEYAWGDLLYRDIYFGSDRFQGQSVVYFRQVPVWGMVYSGGVFALNVPPETGIYPFLKRALRLVPEDEPFRGPRLFAEGHLVYRNVPEGDLAAFRGQEEIEFDGRVVYRLYYAGGSILGAD